MRLYLYETYQMDFFFPNPQLCRDDRYNRALFFVLDDRVAALLSKDVSAGVLFGVFISRVSEVVECSRKTALIRRSTQFIVL